MSAWVSFETRLERSRIVERNVAAWLQKNGELILPVYDYSGLGSDKAPRLQAFSSDDSLVTPDLLAARDGTMRWVEIKEKTRACGRGPNDILWTGVSLRLWREYLRVWAVSGADVHLLFAHRAENLVKIAPLRTLSIAGCFRETGPSYMDRVGMVWFPWDQNDDLYSVKLQTIGSYDDIVGADLRREAA